MRHDVKMGQDPRTWNLGSWDPSQSLKVGPRTPQSFRSRTQGLSSKFKSGTPELPPQFKGGTSGLHHSFMNFIIIIIIIIIIISKSLILFFFFDFFFNSMQNKYQLWLAKSNSQH